MEQKKRTRTDSTKDGIRPKRSRTPKNNEKLESKPLQSSNYDNVIRMQRYPDFHTMLDQKHLTNTIGHFYNSNRKILETAINDPHMSIGELQALVLNSDAIDSESTTKLKSKQYVDTRLFGKPTDKVELTGAGGKAIELETTQKKKEIREMSDEELQIMIKAMQIAVGKSE